jgi:Cys-rich four helix bundle protein (predicted Tat secretion target)
MLGKGDTELAECNLRVNEMLATCGAMVKLAAYQSERAKEIAKACVAACEACKAACEKHSKHPECKACIESCDACIKACKKAFSV